MIPNLTTPDNLFLPDNLMPGDKAAILAPSSPVAPELVEKVKNSIGFLGLKPIIMESCRCNHGYLAGDDKTRAADINRAFADKEIKGIFALRGGYGATRILDMLDYRVIRQNPKVFVGYSDITALHLAFNKLCRFITYHGPMPNTGYDKMDSFSLESLKRAIFKSPSAYKLENPKGHSMKALFPGKGRGLLTGGNLSLLQGTLGSTYEVDTKGKILFIEEVNEELYKVDKALTALALAGKFRDTEAVILGPFVNCGSQSRDDSLTLNNIIEEVILPWRKPVVGNFRAGHIYPQSTLPMGATLDVNITLTGGISITTHYGCPTDERRRFHQ